MTREEETRLINSVINGNVEDFELLVLEHQKLVYNIALKMVGNAHDAEDVAQDAFVKAYNSLQNFRGDSKFSVWIYRLTSNVALDFLRTKKRHNHISFSQYNTEDEPMEIEVSDSRYAPETEFEKKELQEAVNRGLLELPPDHREILLLRELSGLSYDEIAERLELEYGTVKSRIFRARKKLCNILEKDWNFYGFSSSKK